MNVQNIFISHVQNFPKVENFLGVKLKWYGMLKKETRIFSFNFRNFFRGSDKSFYSPILKRWLERDRYMTSYSCLALTNALR